jgi:ABC-type glutathione transport system ATPase component
MTGTAPLLEVTDLSVAFGRTEVVRGLSFAIRPGETVALVGESGSGKSVTCLAIMGLLPQPEARVTGGRALFAGRDLLSLSDKALRAIRGNRIGMVFQEPMTSLNPVIRIGLQLTEALGAHRGLGRRAARQRAAEMLALVGIDAPERRLAQYPHELSGGMRQRVMLAMTMLLEPALLIADEPTTALDVTVQAQILALMRNLQRRFSTSLLLVSHDMGVVAEMADRVLVLRDGRMVEAGESGALFAAPSAPYTRELLAAVPRIDTPLPARPAPVARSPILRLDGVAKRFGQELRWWPGRRHVVQAVDGVALSIGIGETLALVGESGSGKSALGRLVARLEQPDAGRIEVAGQDITRACGASLRRARRAVQMVFQDPYASLDPRFTIGATLAEPMAIHGLARGREANDRAAALLRRVGMPPEALQRYPHQFSGGQRQRIAIARALAAEPRLLVADEPTSALDVSVQAQVLGLLEDLQAELGLSFLFISHDLAVVRRVSHRIAVMRAGRILELAPADRLFAQPRHPYTRALLAAVPVPDPAVARRQRAVLPPASETYPTGPLAEAEPGHWVAT